MSVQPNFKTSTFDEYWFEAIGLPSKDFRDSQYGEMNARNPKLSVKPMSYQHREQCPEFNGAKYGWVVAAMIARLENETECYLEAYKPLIEGGRYGQHVLIPEADVGVFIEGGKAGPMISIGQMGIQWTPWSNEVYVPFPRKMITPETGGYFGFVLDKEIPSERAQFGLLKGDEQEHTPITVKFALIPLPEDYPWGR